MPYRTSSRLILKIESEYREQNGFIIKDRDLPPILLQMESDGDSMRCLNKRGQLIWLLTPDCARELAQEEKDCRNEDDYHR